MRLANVPQRNLVLQQCVKLIRIGHFGIKDNFLTVSLRKRTRNPGISGSELELVYHLNVAGPRADAPYVGAGVDLRTPVSRTLCPQGSTACQFVGLSRQYRRELLPATSM
jgi:hypothetical protein